MNTYIVKHIYLIQNLNGLIIKTESKSNLWFIIPHLENWFSAQHHFFHLTLTINQLFDWPVVVNPVPEDDFLFL